MPAAVERNFAATLERVKPKAERLIAQYPQARSALLAILHEFQGIEGWISTEAMSATAEMLGLPLAVVESTASFYTLFFRRPVGKYMLQVCRNLSCTLGGAEAAMAHFRERLGVGHLETTPDGLFSYEEVECLAACDRAPCMQINLEYVYDLTTLKIDELLEQMRAGTFDVDPLPQTAAPQRSWHVTAETGRKAPGARDVVDPNDPGGIGDSAGREMLERIAEDPRLIAERPTSERLVRDRRERLVTLHSDGPPD